jgi:hypothetical protein
MDLTTAFGDRGGQSCSASRASIPSAAPPSLQRAGFATAVRLVGALASGSSCAAIRALVRSEMTPARQRRAPRRRHTRISSVSLDDLESVAVLVEEGEHRPNARPTQKLAHVDPALLEPDVDAFGVSGRQTDPGLDARGRVLPRGYERDCDRCVGRCDLDPPPAELGQRNVAALLEPELVEVELKRLVLVGDGDADVDPRLVCAPVKASRSRSGGPFR